MGIAKLRRETPSAWTTDLGEQIVEICILATEEEATSGLLGKFIEILFRLRLFSEGSPQDQIASAMSKLRGFRLPKQFRAAAAKCSAPKKSTTQPYRPPGKQSIPTAPNSRIAPAIWATMSTAARLAHKAKFP